MQVQNRQLQAKNDMTLQRKVTANNIVIKCADKFVGDEWTINSTL